MSYLVLARKWRPQTFSDLVGQEHVAQTLRNAIAQNRIAHAFLFTGARGVGKTTIARVLAKALNCMSASGPTAEPCARCSACEEIARGNDVDVKEIDGASNNSVDDVRRLQESLPYLPARDRFKVVIIDEVHMLSTGAFNALLKTLEEPPPHVKFIFATTEVHKVPITILSRCQRYDFKLLPTQKIRERLAVILAQENIAHDDAAVALVAREAAGSMRDALSLLDQVIAGVSGTLTGVEAARLIGVANRSVLYDLARAVLGGDAASALKIVDEIGREGYDLSAFAREFLAVLRDLVVAKVVPDPQELLDLADEERADVVAIAQGAERRDLERLFLAWSRTNDELQEAREPRWVIEMALVRIANRPALVPIEDLITRLGDLERRLASGGGGDNPRGPSTGGPSGGASGPSSGASSGGGARTTVASARVGSVSEAPRSPRAEVAGVGALAVREPEWLTRAQARASVVPAPPAEAVLFDTRPSVPPTEHMDVNGAVANLDTWNRVLDVMEGGPVAVLKHAVPLEVSATTIRLGFETGSFYARKVLAPDVQSVIAQAAERAFGMRPSVQIVQGALPPNAPSVARREEERRAEVRAQRENAAREHPFVRAFLDLVGGEIRAIKLGEE